MDNRIYADWAATAPLCEEAAAAMAPFQQGGPANVAVNANANSLHSEGRAAFAAMEAARDDLARTLGARPDEVYFTSGATESDNTAVSGIVSAVAARRRKGNPGFVPHVITTSIEHDAIIQPAHALAHLGVDVTFIDPDANGYIDPQKVRDALTPSTVLVSVMLANNEVGTIEPVADIARIAHEAGALVHTDAVQAFGKIPVNVRDLGVDALSVSGHKICGPKGIGAFFLKKGTPCEPFLRGGGQESGFRSGTQNVSGMAGFAAAAKAVCGAPEAIEAEAARQRALRDELYRGLLAHEGVVQSVACAAGSTDYLPNIANVCVRGLESETMILRFDREGVALSGGSACSSHSLEPSRVLTRLGIERDLALCSLRISIGRYTTEEDVRGILAAFDRVVNWG